MVFTFAGALFSLSFTSIILTRLYHLVYNVFFHPLRDYPGPRLAAASTWWKTYVEVARQQSLVDVLIELHERHGNIVRIGPNELHFSRPSAYHEIYNPSSRWDKERTLYEAFGEDHSSFGLLTYAESKQRKDVLQPMFSRRAILNLQGLVRSNMDHLVEVLSKNNASGNSSDMLFAFRCFAVDNVTKFCFDKSVDAIDAPEFIAPVVEAMDHSLPTFHLFKHFPLFRKTIFSLPPWLAIKASPETAGLTNLQLILGKQVKDVTTNPEVLNDTQYPTIYQRLLDPTAHEGNAIPTATALYEEAQTMLFAGGVTVGDTLMTGLFHILNQPLLHGRLRTELREIWPDKTNSPVLETLETLPFLTATIKESLRTSPGACSPLLRIVPDSGATISGSSIPGGTIVGMSSILVHRSHEVFEDPEVFDPERWMEADSRDMEKWLVSFSRGPRSCLGINLAWCELYIAFATMLRLFDLRLDRAKLIDLSWRDCFTPHFYKDHLRVWCKPVDT